MLSIIIYSIKNSFLKTLHFLVEKLKKVLSIILHLLKKTLENLNQCFKYFFNCFEEKWGKVEKVEKLQKLIVLPEPDLVGTNFGPSQVKCQRLSHSSILQPIIQY
jgi:hypothetical protein